MDELEISIHAPRTGSDKAIWDELCKMRISIHAPRTGSDDERRIPCRFRLLFQSTLPARGATLIQPPRKRYPSISIHAPRTGSDVRNQMRANRAIQFQSTLPARGATASKTRCVCSRRFQSTLPARGATVEDLFGGEVDGYFNPRSPHGERLFDPRFDYFAR